MQQPYVLQKNQQIVTLKNNSYSNNETDQTNLAAEM